ncbi:DedA family protein [Cellulomonas sp. URHE0023]|uniref:DedA family protein n=1 Tax=Cellulomonas sp. URHE0023 TaxID=1380354 RepID=UPI0004881186|nr:VTT domain-containing protein [Cellulomonas sp. URHE0023]
MNVRDAYHLGGVPVGIAIVGLFVIVMARSHATYWAGRGVVRGAQGTHQHDRGPGWWHSTMDRLEQWTSTSAAQKGLGMVRRWGALAVMLAYLTVGLQTAIFASAGLVRMPYLRFTLASIPGALVWAVVWATIGFGAVWGALNLFDASPWALLAGVLVLAVVIGGLVWFRLSRRARRDVPVEPAVPADPA